MSSYQTSRVYQPGQPLETIQAKAISKIIVDTSHQIEGVAQSVVFMKFLTLSGPKSYIDFGGISNNNLKSAATFNALFETNYNIIVLPRYTTVVNKGLFIEKKTVQVKGWGGREVPVEFNR
jgi:hypothetical protein